LHPFEKSEINSCYVCNCYYIRRLFNRPVSTAIIPGNTGSPVGFADCRGKILQAVCPSPGQQCQSNERIS